MNPNYILELYSKHGKKEEGIKPIRDVLVELKKNGMLNPHLDIRSIPYNSGSESLEQEHSNVYQDVLLGEKIKFENLLKNLDNLDGDEVKIYFEEFDCKDKNELKMKVENYIKAVEVKTVRNYLELNKESMKEFRELENKLDS
jgi:hypothetical protein